MGGSSGRSSRPSGSSWKSQAEVGGSEPWTGAAPVATQIRLRRHPTSLARLPDDPDRRTSRLAPPFRLALNLKRPAPALELLWSGAATLTRVIGLVMASRSSRVNLLMTRTRLLMLAAGADPGCVATLPVGLTRRVRMHLDGRDPVTAYSRVGYGCRVRCSASPDLEGCQARKRPSTNTSPTNGVSASRRVRILCVSAIRVLAAAIRFVRRTSRFLVLSPFSWVADATV